MKTRLPLSDNAFSSGLQNEKTLQDKRLKTTLCRHTPLIGRYDLEEEHAIKDLEEEHAIKGRSQELRVKDGRARLGGRWAKKKKKLQGTPGRRCGFQLSMEAADYSSSSSTTSSVGSYNWTKRSYERDISDGGHTILNNHSSCTGADECGTHCYCTDDPARTDQLIREQDSSDEEYLGSSATNWSPDVFLATLGKGNFGIVYLSYSREKKQHFAVKCADVSRPRAMRCLANEASILKTLNSRYVIHYLGERRSRHTTGYPTRSKTMVTELYLSYVKGGTLAEKIRRLRAIKCRMRDEDIKNYTRQILKGLEYLHAKNIVHCDIKGSNILLGGTYLKLSDFGISKYVGKKPGEDNRPIHRVGTRAFMAPEVWRRTELSFPSDIWSLGCTVVQMITGRAPSAKRLLAFLEGLAGRLEEPDLMIPRTFRHTSRDCIDFLGMCFIRDPKERWTCKELLAHPFLKIDHSY